MKLQEIANSIAVGMTSAILTLTISGPVPRIYQEKNKPAYVCIFNQQATLPQRDELESSKQINYKK
ncbi:MAG: hypothetical protein AABW67_02585 [Nanoarchaeota archaeon]